MEIGFQNFGNTCFFNASLQAIIHLSEFREFFQKNYFKENCLLLNSLKTLIESSSKGNSYESLVNLHTLVQKWQKKVILFLFPILIK